MSYVFNSDCFGCAKKETCKDKNKLEEAVKLIHNETFEEGHQGRGEIVLNCINRKGDISYHLTFEQAFYMVKSGLAITRKGWNTSGMYVIQAKLLTDQKIPIDGDGLLLFNVRKGFNTWIPTISDIYATDWGVFQAQSDAGDET